MDSLVGQTLGQYEIVAQVGQGGMATVYKAYQPSISRYVAVKVMNPDTAKEPDFVRRFQVEAKAVAALEHPHILPVYDFGSQDGQTYMVMRLIDGGTVADLLDSNQPLSYAQISGIIDEVADALDYAHSKKIIHRDIKPSNMLLDQQSGVLLTDFGLARIIEVDPKTRLTQTGTVVGTATYMSPEQAADEALDGRSDVYSLGVVLFEMLVGFPPFDADTMIAIALKHLNEPIPSLTHLNPAILPQLEQIVFKAMAKWVDERYQTAGELAQALREVVQTQALDSTTVVARPAPPKPDSRSDTASALRRRYAQKSQQITAADNPGETTRKSKVLGSVVAAAVTTILLATLLFFWLMAGSTLPDTSLVHQLPNTGQITAQLGTFEERYPRSNHSVQYFEGGMMYWWENPAIQLDPIYVLYGQPPGGSDWSQYKNTWTPDEPEVAERCMPTPGPNGPIMGFGRLWCYNASVKEAMGMPLTAEIAANNATIEIFTEGLIISVPDEQHVWVLYNTGEWQRYDSSAQPDNGP